jgi:hypothetical protein
MSPKNIHLKISLIAGLLIMVFATGCYNDKEEILYPASVCDTANVTYSNSIAPIMSSSCVNCHGGAAPSAGFSLDTYTNVKLQVTNGRLWGAVSQAGAFAPMPKGGTKLSNCNLTKIDKWIKAGAPNN